MVYEVKEPRSSMPFLERVWMTFESTAFSPLAFWYAQLQLVVILISTLSFTLETELNCKEFSLAEHDFLTPENCEMFELTWTYCEYVAVAVFTFEFVCRLLSTPSKRRFMTGMMNWVDLIAILPFYVEAIVAATLPPPVADVNGTIVASDEDPLSAFSVFRVVRLVRVFRVFKMGKSSSGLKMMVATMAESLKVLNVLIFMVLIACVVFASAVYNFEQAGVFAGDFLSIPRTFWWALVTMTTVGYGDFYPITPLGRLVAVFASFTGIIIVALPITVIGSNFEKQFDKQDFLEELCEQVTYEDGTCDYGALLKKFRVLDQQGHLLIPMPADEEAMKKMVLEYDVGGQGVLEEADWASLIMDTVCEAHEFTAVTVNKVVIDMSNLQADAKGLADEFHAYQRETDHQYEQLKAMLFGEEEPPALQPAPPAGGGEQQKLVHLQASQAL